MELNDKLVEAIIMSATVGQFGGQVVYETFKLSIDELSAAKKQLATHLVSGLVAFFAYFFTQEAFKCFAKELYEQKDAFFRPAVLEKKYNCNVDLFTPSYDLFKELYPNINFYPFKMDLILRTAQGLLVTMVADQWHELIRKVKETWK